VGEAELEQAFMNKTEEDNISMKSSSEEEELRRAEEYKSKGNEFFKSKCLIRGAHLLSRS
jgi:hypothetical protein